METYGDPGGYGDSGEVYGGANGSGGGARIGGEGAILKPPRPAR